MFDNEENEKSPSLSKSEGINVSAALPPRQAKILVVDDQQDSLELLSTILKLHGHEVKECNRGKSAIEYASISIPDLILLDISMPEMDGFSTCQMLRGDRATQDIPIIFITGLKEAEDKTLAFKFGGNDYITKPFQVEEVIARVEHQLKFYYLQAELKAKNQQLEIEITNRQIAETKLLKLNHELSKLAISDGLTNIANRHYLDRYLAQEWLRGQREKFSLALILGDIDYFKLYNDSLGHQEGDNCLKQVAQALAKAVSRPADLVARYGGEEFAIVLPQTSANNALLLAEKIRFKIQALNIPHPNSLVSDRISLSLGVTAVVPNPQYTEKQLLLTADKALYEAKAEGRNRTVLKPMT